MELAQEILHRLVRYKNGLVSESMEQRGIHYKRNYGVAVHEIKKIATEYPPQQALAQQLWDKRFRETMLAAIYIAQPELLDADQICTWSKDLTNPEIVEQISMYLFYKCPAIKVFLMDWLRGDELFLQKCAWITVARMQPSEWPIEFIEELPQLLSQIDPQVPHFKTSLIYALPLIGKQNEARSIIEVWCKTQRNNPIQKPLINDLIAFYPQFG